MSKFKIFLLLLAVITLVVGLFGWRYITSLHSVSFVLHNDVAIDVHKVIDGKKQNPLNTITASGKVTLENGDFCAQPTTDKYVKDPVCFTVNGADISVDVDPRYSDAALKKLLGDEVSTLKTVITEAYKDVIGGFTISDGVLYNKGEWYGTTLTQITPAPGTKDRDIYRLIAKKEAGTWKILKYPQIALSKYSYTDVPRYILDAVNRL